MKTTRREKLQRSDEKIYDALASPALIQLVCQERDRGHQIHRGVVVMHQRFSCVQRQLWPVEHGTHPFDGCRVGAVELDGSDLSEAIFLLECPSPVQKSKRRRVWGSQA